MRKRSAGQKSLTAGRKTPGSGNRRNPHTHKAIIDATLGLLKTVHYPALTIESIASAAGVGKATVYRWWPSKGALVAEAVSSTLTLEDPPETHDVRADLVAAAEISIRNYAHPPGGTLVTALVADLATDPELLDSFITRFAMPRRNIVRKLIQRAIEHGLLAANIDPDLVMDMWAGAVIYRSLMKHAPIEQEFAAELVNMCVVANAALTITVDGLQTSQQSTA